eukprot:Ihof_evm3s515 gene=Ihof_evmTU3s515
MSLFIGHLGPEIRTRDLEDTFSRYGRLIRCDVKNGGFGFVDYEDRRDAEDAIKEEDGRTIGDSRIVVQWARGPSRRADSGECFKCGKLGHIARECLNFAPGGRGRDSGRGRSPSPYSRRRYSPSPRGRSRSRSPRYSRSPVRRGGSPPRGRRTPPRYYSRSPAPRRSASPPPRQGSLAR